MPEKAIEPSHQFNISRLFRRGFADSEREYLMLKDMAELPESYDEIIISGYRQKIYEYVYICYPDVA